ncbi:MAG: L-glutamate gamma-semialdehyde dehydrogenase [Candidatus Delongbacteria bacterium]|nr:L-glutamate gamma-semialdehyde dehydrogenase [Candidatus Delongbacteria bacterium]
MSAGFYRLERPANEPVKAYAPGSEEKKLLKAELLRQSTTELEIPLIIGGREINSGQLADCVMPHDHQHRLGRYHKAGKREVELAIQAAREAKADWSALPWEERAAIFLKAGELLATRYRPILNAATMLGQSKNAFQAEIDAACELIDFYRYNAFYMQELMKEQPTSAEGIWNRLDTRPLDGFVFAVTPFNFTSIAGNLPTAPAMLGNTVIWKPASSSVYSAWFIMQLLLEAGLPDGVINLVPGRGGEVGNPVMASPELAGVHFTGSTEVFQGMWGTIGRNIQDYKQYPRIVGETGGKDFVFAHASADLKALSTALIRGAFEYQGQKCSAASRAYIPQSLWSGLKALLVEDIATIKLGDVQDFTNFMNAVIDANAFDTITGYIEQARQSTEAEIIIGGGYDKSSGYFIEPTVILAEDPRFVTMAEEIFGPVLTIFVYPDGEYEETLRHCDQTSDYALTGAVFAQDRQAIVTATEALRGTAGNFYINDKPTGAVVGQQPFGGSRASGTNDKAGSLLNMLRWVSPRTIKETFVPPYEYRYPFLDEK